jgi:nitroimidazol reductase NimA-like FMN-containing flavoprotein (pyridoxamine 5'-phosphate oxidase superfamily)
MRRQEFSIENATLLNHVLDTVSWGMLSLQTTDGWPYSVPMNFARSLDRIGMHCALQGKRMELLHTNSQVQFTVVRECSFLPSYTLGGELACPATQFFQSVMIWGKASVVEDSARKAEILQALMNKMQPEGKHLRIDAHPQEYANALKGVAVIEIEPMRQTGKFKFGQNLNADKASALVAFLQKRNLPGDLATAELILKLRPA